MCVEYAWFLTAVFHDTGRVKEGTRQVVDSLRSELDDDDSELTAIGKESRWRRPEYIQARKILGRFAGFVTNRDMRASWDAGAFLSKKAEAEANAKSAEWIASYNSMRHHGIISGLDFLAESCRIAQAADQSRYRPFIATHAVPAAMAIMLHDWKAWEMMRPMKLIPVNMPTFPMAALLIYIDTWDNYKRRGIDPLTYIKNYVITQRGVSVVIEWGDKQLMRVDEKGYTDYITGLENLLFALDIKYGMAGHA